MLRMPRPALQMAKDREEGDFLVKVGCETCSAGCSKMGKARDTLSKMYETKSRLDCGCGCKEEGSERTEREEEAVYMQSHASTILPRWSLLSSLLLSTCDEWHRRINEVAGQSTRR
nr:hypothetical protein CFP56_21075 [Quercus suber]